MLMAALSSSRVCPTRAVTSSRAGPTVGADALDANTTGTGNTALGRNALGTNATGNNNTALGVSALNAGFTNFTNTTGVGANTQVTASNQVQLGDSATTTFAFGAVQNRSDLRDKADVRDTALGLDFITALRPVDFRWDLREDYRPTMPEDPGAEASEAERAAYQTKLDQWAEASRLGKISHDGSQKRSRFHHGLIAQEVAEVIAETGTDFGGFQNHAVKGGDDVLSLGYEEFIAPLIKAVQELAQQNHELAARNDELRDEVTHLRQLEARLAALEAMAKKFDLAFEEILRLAVFRPRTERALGAHLAQTVKRGGDRPKFPRGTLPHGLPDWVDKKRSSAFQKLAAIPDAVFESYLLEAGSLRRVPSELGARRFGGEPPEAFPFTGPTPAS